MSRKSTLSDFTLLGLYLYPPLPLSLLLSLSDPLVSSIYVKQTLRLHLSIYGFSSSFSCDMISPSKITS
jgi:hypothetical protein